MFKKSTCPRGTDLAPHIARGTVAAILAGFAAVYVLAINSRQSGALQLLAAAVVAAAIFGIQLAYVYPNLKRRLGVRLLALQAVLVYLAVIPLGTSVGMLGFLVGSLLLSSAWPVAMVVVGSAVLVETTRAPDLAATVSITIGTVLTGLVIYGLAQLADRVEDLSAARLALAMAAVAEERLRVATELNEKIGVGLDAVNRLTVEPPDEVIDEVLEVARRSLADARAAAVDYRSMSLSPEIARARALLSTAGVEVEGRTRHTEPLGPPGVLLGAVLREAVTGIVDLGQARRCVVETTEDNGLVGLRVVSDGALDVGCLDGLVGQFQDAGGRLTAGSEADGCSVVKATIPVCSKPAASLPGSAYSLSVTLLVVVLAGFAAKVLLYVPVRALAGAAACLAVMAVLQLRGTRDRPLLSLSVQAVLSFLPILWFGRGWLNVPGFMVGSLLLVLPPALSWPLTVLAMAGVATAGVLLSLGVTVVVNLTIGVLVTGLVVSGLARLTRLIKELQATREEPARTAIAQERLRVARDLHDLLGHNLAAILLKCELVRRLLDRDPGRARAELADIVVISERARADMRAVSGGHLELSLEEEAASARAILTTAGIEVRIDLDHGPPPAFDDPAVNTVLSAVLREAVTNVLRHSSARRCRIETGYAQGLFRLIVANDGLPHDAVRSPAGSGLGNLTARLAIVGGRLTAAPEEDGWFRLRVVLDLARLSPDLTRDGA
ncbi:sensor histidine kinase [Streptosporangium carneum]|uniref:Two-component sensor histidine kinase n=1 Tax=Streptosporangium carneum TaxID=47481 RepID=A0A9W6I350_9ACTN|nr:histidine kinase [Streptosporangium carneum]GLK10551.1 two-component sensor histidine kinase [Streptosporangium carneum]